MLCVHAWVHCIGTVCMRVLLIYYSLAAPLFISFHRPLYMHVSLYLPCYTVLVLVHVYVHVYVCAMLYPYIFLYTIHGKNIVSLYSHGYLGQAVIRGRARHTLRAVCAWQDQDHGAAGSLSQCQRR